MMADENDLRNEIIRGLVFAHGISIQLMTTTDSLENREEYFAAAQKTMETIGALVEGTITVTVAKEVKDVGLWQIGAQSGRLNPE